MKAAGEGTSCPLLVPALAVLAGISLGAGFPHAPRLALAALVLGITFIDRFNVLPASLFAAAGFLSGISLADGGRAPQHASALAPIAGTVSSSRFVPGGAAFFLDAEAVGPLSVRAPGIPPPPIGTRAVVYGEMRPRTGARNPGAPPGARLGVTLETSAAYFEMRPAPLVRRTIEGVRLRLRARLGRHLAGDPLALSRALLLGDRSGLSHALTDRFRSLGLAHLLAISGLHVGVLGVLLAFVARTLRPRGTAWGVFAAVGLVLYAPIAGAGASVVRAATGGAIALVLLARGVRFDPMNLLAASFLASTAVDPASVRAPGFALSYAATAGILVYVRLSDRAPVLRGRGLGWLLVSVAATIATLPLLAGFFGPIPLGGILWSAPGGVLVLGALVPGFLLLPVADVPLVGSIVSAAAWVPLRLLALSTDLPLPAPAIVAAPGALVALGVAGVALVLLLRAPARALALLAIALWCWVAERGDRTTEAEIVMLDVGAGDCLLVRTPGGRAFLIDTGRPAHAFVVARALRALDVREVSLVVTHPDEDHDGGVTSLVDEGIVDTLFVGITETERARYGLPPERVRALARGDTLAQGAFGSITVLHPARADSALPDNARSVVLRLVTGTKSALFLGDLDGTGLERLLDRCRRGAGDPLVASVLKLGHHGAAAATPSELVRRVRPEIILVSTGRELPAPTRDVLATHPAPIFSTHDLGAVRVSLDPRGLAAARWARGWIPMLGEGLSGGR